MGYLDVGGAFTLVTPMIGQEAACLARYVSPNKKLGVLPATRVATSENAKPTRG